MIEERIARIEAKQALMADVLIQFIAERAVLGAVMKGLCESVGAQDSVARALRSSLERAYANELATAPNECQLEAFEVCANHLLRDLAAAKSAIERS